MNDKAEKARLASRLKSLNTHRKALESAIAELGGSELDSEAWKKVFESDDPDDVNQRMSVTGNFSALINNYVEMVRKGVILAGLIGGRRPQAQTSLELAVADGGLSQPQSALVQEIYKLEGKIEHLSPDVTADQVREAIEQLRKSLPGLVKSLVRWLNRHGIKLA